MIILSVDYTMARRKRCDFALRQDCECVLFALQGKSKLVLVTFTNWYNGKCCRQINGSKPSGILHHSSKDSISGISGAIGVTT
jgi:hypothetical protein